MELVARYEACGEPPHESDDYDFIAEGVVTICRACVEDEEDRLREEFGWIGAGLGDDAVRVVLDVKGPTCEHRL